LIYDVKERFPQLLQGLGVKLIGFPLANASLKCAMK
jgi:hypothetical protein